MSIISSSFNFFILILNNKFANIFIWHQRFIHINYHHIINDNKKIIDLYYHNEISIHFCKSCFLNKQKTFISRMFITKTIFFFNYIHVDIGENFFQTFQNYKYFLFIKNDTTNMFFVKLIKWKNEIFFHLQQFRTWIELQKPDHKIKKIKTNVELTEHRFNEWYKKTGIQWKSSAPNIFV